MIYVHTNPEKAFLEISAQKRTFSNSKRDYMIKTKVLAVKV